MLNNKQNIVSNGNISIKNVNNDLNDLRRLVRDKWINTNKVLSIRSTSPNLSVNNRVRKNLPKANTGRVFNSYDDVNTFNAKSNTNKSNTNHIEYSEELEMLDPYNEANNNTETINKKKSKKRSKDKPKKKTNNKKHRTLIQKVINKIQNGDYYPYKEKNGVIIKVQGKGENKTYNPVIYGTITNYQVLRQYGDDGTIIHKITIEKEGETYNYEAGSTEEIRDWIYRNNFGKDKRMILDFLNHTIAILRNETTKYGILGGYRRLEDIQPPKNNKPATYLNKWLKENLGEEQLRLFKSLILLPFHSIIRNDEDAEPRGLVRGVIANGDSDQLKSLTTNYYINCFTTHNTVPLSDNRSSDSFPALRNDCHNNTGILMCDEADKLIVDWIGGGKLVPDAVNFLKRMEQARSVNVADLNRQGSNMGSLLNSTPVFIWNGFIEYVPAPLNDRLLYCPFHKENKPTIKQKWKLSNGKKQMVLFGEHLSYAFKKCYNEIRVMNTEEATNTILQYLNDEYGYDLTFLKETRLMYTDILQQDTNIQENITGALRSYISQSKIDDDYDPIPASQQLQDNKKFKTHLSYCKTGADGFLRIKCKSFTDWVNRKVLNGGETTPEEIAEIFNWEIRKYRRVKVFEVTNIQISELLDLNKKTPEEDKQ